MKLDELATHNTELVEAETRRVSANYIRVIVNLEMDAGSYGASRQFSADIYDQGAGIQLSGIPEEKKRERLYRLIEWAIHQDVLDWVMMVKQFGNEKL